MAAKKSIPANKRVEFSATGRRKQSIARVRLVPNGNGIITINKKFQNIKFTVYKIYVFKKDILPKKFLDIIILVL